jgi:hypothetical protein
MGTNIIWRATVTNWKHLGASTRIPEATLITLHNRIGDHYIVLQGDVLINIGEKVTITEKGNEIFAIQTGFDPNGNLLWVWNPLDPQKWGYHIDHQVEVCEKTKYGVCQHWGHFFFMPQYIRELFVKRFNPYYEEETTGRVIHHPVLIPGGYAYFYNQLPKRYFRIYWLDGKNEEGPGASINDAFTRLGYGAGALHAVDYFKELTASVLAQELIELQAPLNDGRGHQVSRDIAMFLGNGRVNDAQALVHSEADKFDWVPQIKEWLLKYLLDDGDDPWFKPHQLRK